MKLQFMLFESNLPLAFGTEFFTLAFGTELLPHFVGDACDLLGE